jgi:hypothetical protein
MYLSHSRCRFSFVLLLFAAMNGPRALAECPPDWAPGFHFPSLDGQINAMAVFDEDGAGPMAPTLFISGLFQSAGDRLAVNGLARWNASSWEGFPYPHPASVYAFTVFDDGSGPALYAAGQFLSSGFDDWDVVKWDGTTWTPLGSGLNGPLFALAAFDDGSGNGAMLYVGGEFTTASGTNTKGIARWDGTGWLPLAVELSGPAPYQEYVVVMALTVFDDGSGPGLFVGGGFESARGTILNSVGKWNGSNWSALGAGMGVGGQVNALTTFDDGTGSALYAAGDTATVDTSEVLKWDGVSWSTVGGGFQYNGDAGYHYSLAVYNDGSGSGPALYAGGEFDSAGGVSAKGIAKWDGTSWTSLGSGVESLGGYGTPYITTLAVLDDGSGRPRLIAGGAFDRANGMGFKNIAAWDGSDWGGLGDGGNGIDDPVMALAVVDHDGPGPTDPVLYAGGLFSIAGEVVANSVAAWDGYAWSAAGMGADGRFVEGDGWYPARVTALTGWDGGLAGGVSLYVGGSFTSVSGVPAANMARWDGAQWTALDSGVGVFDGFPVASVLALGVFDDVSGEALYAGGLFTDAGGITVNNVARWNGTAWSALGSGTDGAVLALAVFDDGAGPALYAAGYFTTAGGVAASNIAKWDGSNWSAVGGGVEGNAISALLVHDDGQGPALYAAGGFTSAGGNSANYVARWDGTTWSPIGSGLEGGVRTLGVFDDGSGSGPALYAGGQFYHTGSPFELIAKWDGASWLPLGGSFSTFFYGQHFVLTMAAFDDGRGGGPALYVGGQFQGAENSFPGGLIASRNIARWRQGDADGDAVCTSDDNCPNDANAGQADCNADGQGDACDPEVGERDADNDAICDGMDNCVAKPNALQSNVDGDALGDLCDPCPARTDNVCNTGGSAAEEVSPVTGGTLQTPDGALTLGIDPGDAGADVTISVTRIRPASPAVDIRFGFGTGLGSAVAVYDFEPDNLVFDAPVTLAVVQDVSALSPLQRANLTLYTLDQSTQQFVPIPGKMCAVLESPADVFTATCTAEITHFSTYAMVAPLDTDGDGVFDKFDGVVDNCPTVANAAQTDTDNDGMGDACEAPRPLAAPGGALKNRSIALSLPGTATAGPATATALRVTLVALQEPAPANSSCCPPPDFSAYEAGPTCTDAGGCVRWIGKPGTYYESQDNHAFGNFRAARLQCTPYYHDWSGEGLVQIAGAEIIASSAYEVENLPATCMGTEMTCVEDSPPLVLTTARWGDIAANFNPPSTSTQPDAIDVTQLVNKFKNVPGAPIKPIAQLQPNLPELNANINALDIVAVVDAVKGFAYPFSGPCPCPSNAMCNTVECPSGPAPCIVSPLPGLGAGAMCVKTCDTGDNAGEPCINNSHCPGGACGNPFCRDRCGRCTP